MRDQQVQAIAGGHYYARARLSAPSQSSTKEPHGFSDSQIELLKTFAEQAVIAIGSAETYRALQERTAALAQRNSEFGERIEQQAATIDVLKVMSSTPDDTQPVFDLIVRRAQELCNGVGGDAVRIRWRTGPFRCVVGVRSEVVRIDGGYRQSFPMAPTRGSITCRAILDKQIIHVRDVEAEPGAVHGRARHCAECSRRRSDPAAARRRWRSVPSRYRPAEPGGFSDSQVALLQTFAEQAVIAITSVANFRALRERTAALARSVAELQALEEVLRAVNSSLDLDTVLATIISRAVRLSRADEGTIYEFDEAEEVFVPKVSLRHDRGTGGRRCATGASGSAKPISAAARRTRAPVHVADAAAGPDDAGSAGAGACTASTPCSPCRCCARTR